MCHASDIQIRFHIQRWTFASTKQTWPASSRTLHERVVWKKVKYEKLLFVLPLWRVHCRGPDCLHLAETQVTQLSFRAARDTFVPRPCCSVAAHASLTSLNESDWTFSLCLLLHFTLGLSPGLCGVGRKSARCVPVCVLSGPLFLTAQCCVCVCAPTHKWGNSMCQAPYVCRT